MSAHTDNKSPATLRRKTSGNAPRLLDILQDRLLGTRLYIHSIARYAIVAGIFFGAIFAGFIVGVENLPYRILFTLAAVLGLYNTVVFIIVRRFARHAIQQPSHRFLAGLTHATILFDYIILTLLLWAVGGVKSPFVAFYILHVILASLLLSPRASYAHAIMGYVLMAGLAAAQWLGIIPTPMPIGAVNSATPLDGRYVLTSLTALGFLMGLSAFLMNGVTHMIRQGQRQLSDANEELERLSQMRRDFLHIALHDLKAPADAVAMLLGNLESEIGGPLTEQQSKWVARCQVRLKEMRGFLHDFQVLSVLDSSEIEAQGQPLDLNEMLRQLVEEHQDLAQGKMHSLTLDVPAPLPASYGIERLVREAIANLITNAIKYTPLGGTINVRGTQNGLCVRVEVSDNGIGIPPDQINSLFKEFVRLKHPTNRTGKVSGSGLGLSIVRRIVELHGGTVSVTSAANEGSTFTIDLPTRTS
ncbi:MAG: hypothetical protein K1Y02_23655 [Candidatus Hydrogenedentes bacterium]|nr:hypothetical protein [Candidatus Hydrogenedentota bacterium]